MRPGQTIRGPILEVRGGFALLDVMGIPGLLDLGALRGWLVDLAPADATPPPPVQLPAACVLGVNSRIPSRRRVLVLASAGLIAVDSACAPKSLPRAGQSCASPGSARGRFLTSLRCLWNRRWRCNRRGDYLDGWQTAGHGSFVALPDGSIESEGGPGLLWYAREQFADFTLRLEWRLSDITDNSGVFVRIPPLGADDPDNDAQPAIDLGYEIQIDDRGFNPGANAFDDRLHRTGAVYALSPSSRLASRAVGEWNEYEISVWGRRIDVTLNGEPVTSYQDTDGNPNRLLSGYIALQNHHPGARVLFRSLRIMQLAAG